MRVTGLHSNSYKTNRAKKIFSISNGKNQIQYTPYWNPLPYYK